MKNKFKGIFIHKNVTSNLKGLFKKNNNRGQALFEFLIFLPIMFTLYSITVTLANSINGSINQQKYTRGYFFSIIHNDSNFPGIYLDTMKGTRVGMFAMGWKMGDSGETPIAPCYRMFSLSNNSTPGKGPAPEECSPGDGKIKAQYVRVKTVFGVCTESYVKNSGPWTKAINVGQQIAHPSACQISN